MKTPKNTKEIEQWVDTCLNSIAAFKAKPIRRNTFDEELNDLQALVGDPKWLVVFSRGREYALKTALKTFKK